MHKRRHRREGRKLLQLVPHYNIESGSDKPVTVAHKHIQANAIKPPAIINVKRNKHTIDCYFWSEKGLFAAQYVEENYHLFPSLQSYELRTPFVKQELREYATARIFQGHSHLSRYSHEKLGSVDRGQGSPRLRKLQPKLNSLDHWIRALFSNDVNSRLRALEELTRLGDERATPAICEVLRNDPDPEVRCLAAEALGQIFG